MKNYLSPKMFNFLKQLKENNNREWFAENKAQFESAKTEMQAFFEATQAQLEQEDEFGKCKVYRIYRDARFSQDKTPYKTHMAAIFMRKQPHNRGSFYVHIEPGNSFIGGGFWNSEKDDLLRIRQGIEQEDELEIILNQKELVNKLGELKGDAVKTTPKGFPKDHPRIDLLRKKQFILSRPLSDDEVLSYNLISTIIETYKLMQPFFMYMTDVLTTDANGESIL